MLNRHQDPSSHAPWPFAEEVLAERLVHHRYLPGPYAAQLLEEARRWRSSLPRILRARGVMSNDELRDSIAYVFGLPVVDPDARALSRSDLPNYPDELVTARLAIPVGVEENRLLVAVDDPTRADVLANLYQKTGRVLDLRVATPAQMAALAQGDAAGPEPEEIGAPVLDDSDAEPWDTGKQSDVRWSVHRKAAWIAFASRIIAQAIGGAALVFLGIALAGGLPDRCGPAAPEQETTTQSR